MGATIDSGGVGWVMLTGEANELLDRTRASTPETDA
jgi:hypothetical protein